MKALVIAGALGLLLGGWLGWNLHPKLKAAPMEKPAAEIRLEGGGLVLKREVAGNVPPVPKGAPVGHVARRQTVDLEPTKPGPIHLELLQVQTPEGTRAVVTADGARITGGTDWVIAPHRPTLEARKWAAQALWSPQAGWGAQVSRSWGPVVVSGAAWRDRVAVGVGVTW